MGSAGSRASRPCCCAPFAILLVAALTSLPAAADEFDTALPVAVIAADEVSVDDEVAAPGDGLHPLDTLGNAYQNDIFCVAALSNLLDIRKNRLSQL